MKISYAFSLLILILVMFLSACSNQVAPESTASEITTAQQEVETPSSGTMTENPTADQSDSIETLVSGPTSPEARKDVVEMTEKELVEAVADYHYLVDIYASSVSFGDGLDGLAKHCPAFAELKSRENWQAALEQYGNELIEQYKQTPRSDGRTEFVSSALTDIIQYVTGKWSEQDPSGK